MTALPRGLVHTVVAWGLIQSSAPGAVPDWRLFVLQQRSQIRVIQIGRLLPAPLLQVNTDPSREHGS